jgi:hypothetical protein
VPKPRKPLRFAVGDRVIRKFNPFSVTGNAPKTMPVKRGVVVAITYKTNIRKASHPYVTVKFDGSERTEDFMQSRIEHEADYDRMLADTIESVNVF